jgi:hypothetical protein
MSQFTIGAYEMEQAVASDFPELLAIIKGRSVISAADWGNDRFELGLSGNLMIRFFQTEGGMTINLISTQNTDENPSLVVDLGNMNQRVPISIIENKLRGLRTIYAAFYLIYDGREMELQSYLIKHPHGDFERALLGLDEQLYIESISYGSWVVTVWSKTKKAYKAIQSVAGLVFEEGRAAFISKIQADAKLIHAQANKELVQVKKESLELEKSQFDYLLELSDKMEIPEVKEQLKSRIIQATKNFTMGDMTDGESYRRLEEQNKN